MKRMLSIENAMKIFKKNFHFDYLSFKKYIFNIINNIDFI